MATYIQGKGFKTKIGNTYLNNFGGDEKYLTHFPSSVLGFCEQGPRAPPGYYSITRILLDIERLRLQKCIHGNRMGKQEPNDETGNDSVTWD